MNNKQLAVLTKWLSDNVFKNPDIMYNRELLEQEIELNGQVFDIIDIIASLHNLLCEQVTGNRYNYMFHWCNKIGSDCIDDIFDSLIDNVKGDDK